MNVATQEVCLLSVVGKLYGRVLIKRVRGGTECAIGEQCGFRQGRRLMDKVFVVTHTLRGRIGKEATSHAAVARSIPAEVTVICIMHDSLREYCI